MRPVQPRRQLMARPPQRRPLWPRWPPPSPPPMSVRMISRAAQAAPAVAASACGYPLAWSVTQCCHCTRAIACTMCVARELSGESCVAVAEGTSTCAQGWAHHDFKWQCAYSCALGARDFGARGHRVVALLSFCAALCHVSHGVRAAARRLSPRLLAQRVPPLLQGHRRLRALRRVARAPRARRRRRLLCHARPRGGNNRGRGRSCTAPSVAAAVRAALARC